MRVTFRMPLLWTALCLFFFAGVLVCLVSWFVLLSTICSNPRSPDPQTQHVAVYNCHGMKVYLSPVDEAMLHWLTPAGLAFMFLSFGCGAMVAKTALKTWQRGAPGRVRITAVPPGEAPQWVREKWVGLELPLAQSASGAMQWRAAGVLTGPRGLAATAARIVTGRMPEKKGFVVNVLDSMAVLERSSPEAAQWWRTNAAHLMAPTRHFVFPENVCAMLPPLPTAHSGDPPPGAAHFPAPPKE